MQTRVLEFICCPKCLGELHLDGVDKSPGVDSWPGDVDEGFLSCTCGESYPVTNGIPRLLPDAMAEFHAFSEAHIQAEPGQALGRPQSRPNAWKTDAGQRQVRDRFERQWRLWGREKRIFGKPTEQMVDNLLNDRIGTTIGREFYPGKLVLDAGCGHGRYVTAFAGLGAEAVGVDIGMGIDIAQQHAANRRNTHFLQGDILLLPVRDSSFDLVFSDGVIHHTPSSHEAFKRLAKAVKPGGYLYIWVYPKGSAFWEISQAFLRIITTRVPPRLLYHLCFVPVPLLSLVPTYSATTLSNSSWLQCAQVVWDWYSPRYQWHHTQEQVLGWYLNEGFEDVEFLPVPVGAIGRKPEPRAAGPTGGQP